jgi:cell wall-associated NlpC family hydrolase
MANYAAMGKRVTHHRLARLAAGAGLAACILTASGQAFAGSGASTPPATGSGPTTTTTLPPIPKVDRSLTDGQNPATLLANAIELSSVGIDSSALTFAMAATQAKLDADASVASKAAAAADVADRRAADALATANQAEDQYQNMDGAVKEAVVDLYMGGPAPLQVSSQAGASALYAQTYASSTLTPYGVLATQHEVANVRQKALGEATAAQKLANRDQAKADRAVAAERAEATRLENELKAISSASAAEVAADHFALAGQAGKELLAASGLQFNPKTRIPPPVSTTPIALTWAFAELGKPYVWGATGPNSFDCSGLTQFVWHAAGVNTPRVAADQDAWSIPVPLSDLLPGDLVFYGRTDIHHVGIYIGDGLMINAPHTGTFVQVSSIWWSDLAGFGRVHSPGTPIPPHQPPSTGKPAKPVVVPNAGPVPSQTKPPKGWKPKPGSTTPIRVNGTPPTTVQPTTTTSSSTSTTSTSTTTTVPGSTTTVSTTTTVARSP